MYLTIMESNFHSQLSFLEEVILSEHASIVTSINMHEYKYFALSKGSSTFANLAFTMHTSPMPLQTLEGVSK